MKKIFSCTILAVIGIFTAVMCSACSLQGLFGEQSYTVTYYVGEEVYKTFEVQEGEMINLIDYQYETDTQLFNGWEVDGIGAALSGTYFVYEDTNFIADIADKDWVKTIVATLPNFSADNVWHDQANYYYSDGAKQCVFDSATKSWQVKNWQGDIANQLIGAYVWNCGDTCFYSTGEYQYQLDGDTWNKVAWQGFPQDAWNSNVVGTNVWQLGEQCYYSIFTDYYNYQLKLDVASMTWQKVEWDGLTYLDGQNVWNIGDKYFYSYGEHQYQFNVEQGKWEEKHWSGLQNFYGMNVWNAGDKYYYTNGDVQYVLNDGKWEVKTWVGVKPSTVNKIWTDGTDCYLLSDNFNYVLKK